MNRKLLVSLLRKSIEELEMITDGFMEMDEYPKVILQLAKRKTEDIQSIIEQLSEIKPASSIVSSQIAEADSSLPPEFERSVQEEPTQEISVHQPEPTDQIEKESKIITEQQPIVPLEQVSEIQQDVEPVKVIELEESIELLSEIAINDVFAEEEGMKTIELDELEELNTKIKMDSSVSEELPETEVIPVTEPQTPPARKESRVEELLNRTTSEETKIVTLADKIAPSNISRSEKLSQADNSLSASIANKKIDDIKQAISIGDRFRFQRELFGGNGEDMNKTLNYINQLASLEEVMSFLHNKYKWVEDDNDVMDFMQIVKRRFS